jgi:peptidoglycan/LPS O-acetylase OafA/YrhL
VRTGRRQLYIEHVRRLGHVPALDGVRGIAIALVLVHHIAPVTFVGGSFGVDLFFILSGFLITSLLLDEWHTVGRISLSGFYIRRARRLLPALVLLLAACLVAGTIIGQFHDAAISSLLGLGYVMNFAVVQGYAAFPLTHLWSLSQEEQFYLLWPALLVLALKRAVRPSVLCLTLLALAIADIAYRQVLLIHSIQRAQLAPDARSFGILFGCAIGVAFVYRLARLPRWLPLALIAPLLLSLWIYPVPGHLERGPTSATFVICSTVWVFVLADAPDWWVSRAFSFAPLRWLGRISYGVYLWHYPLYAAFGWKLGLPLSLVIAALSYRYVEKRFLRRRPRPRSTSQPSAVAVPA